MKMTNASICRVTLAPELEAIAGQLPALARRQLARDFKKWARQLEVSAFIMERDRRRACGPRPTPVLKRLPLHVLVRN
jgi:hypothetical protein